MRLDSGVSRLQNSESEKVYSKDKLKRVLVRNIINKKGCGVRKKQTQTPDASRKMEKSKYI